MTGSASTNAAESNVSRCGHIAVSTRISVPPAIANTFIYTATCRGMVTSRMQSEPTGALYVGFVDGEDEKIYILRTITCC